MTNLYTFKSNTYYHYKFIYNDDNYRSLIYMKDDEHIDYWSIYNTTNGRYYVLDLCNLSNYDEYFRKKLDNINDISQIDILHIFIDKSEGTIKRVNLIDKSLIIELIFTNGDIFKFIFQPLQIDLNKYHYMLHLVKNNDCLNFIQL